MKKLILGIAVVVGSLMPAMAENLCTDWGRFGACVPILSGIDAAFGYDFKSHTSKGLAETPFASVSLNSDSKVVFTFGAVTTEDSKGAPFVGFNYALKGINNPIPGITEIKPGIFGGHDFHEHEDFYGFKASIPVFE